MDIGAEAIVSGLGSRDEIPLAGVAAENAI